ncbi:GntR family transcriptional regulator [Desulfofalx alkaliphila]|uniref:GntR family transcriptional regulator n=1 Tax=Desulfofalx alkaliphila TaxID=105483 RepID=UPI00068D1D27|nr:GntR family transcriptional regulator [Desulfofalx alkaliphila]
MEKMRDNVYSRLRKAILKGKFQPGDRLVERKLAEKLNVSRTPIREAIRMLELEGLVSHIPRVGSVVSSIDAVEVHEIYRIRAVLEGLAARMAAERIKPEQLQQLTVTLQKIEQAIIDNKIDKLEELHLDFNRLIYESAESTRLYNMITSMVDFINRFTMVGYTRPGRIAQAHKEHRLIVEAIKLRDGELAERVAREHIENSRYAYFKSIGEQET